MWQPSRRKAGQGESLPRRERVLVNPQAWARRAVRALLYLYPRDFRDRYGAEVLAFFDDAWTEHPGRMGRLRVLGRTLRGVLMNGMIERVGRDRPGTLVGRWTMGWRQDVRFAIRAMKRRPTFAVVAVLTIALGIGAASAVFAVVDGVVLRPLPYPQEDRLVAMWTTFDGQGDFGMSLAEHYDFVQDSRALETMGSFYEGQATITGLGASRRVSVAWSWGDLYDVIGADVEFGRLPGPEDRRSGAAPVVVLSHRFWSEAMASDPGAVGRTLDFDGQSAEVIGVMGADVRLPALAPDLWRPIARDRADIVDRSGHSLEGIGRLAPGAELSTLRAEIDQVHVRWADEWAGVHSPGHPGHSLASDGLHERWFGDLRSAGRLLVAALFLVLALACANVASLLMAHGESRAGELALRQALGAGRARIVRQLLVESLVLAVMGGLIGIVLAGWGVDLLLRLEPGDLPRVDTVGLDGRVSAFAVLATLGSALTFGLIPAFRGGRKAVRNGRGSGPDRSLSRSLRALVVGQVGLAVLLLAGAGLLTRSVSALAEAEIGLETEGRLTFQVTTTQAAYPDMPAIAEFWDRLIRDVEAVPGIEQAAAVRLLPLRDGLRREGMTVVGRDVEREDQGAIAYGVVTPGYFSVTGVPVLQGREFESTDEPGSPWVGLVSESAARAFWPEGNPVGEQVMPMFMATSASPVTIVGVVADVRAEGPQATVVPQLYLNYAQTPESGRGYVRGGVVVAKTDVPPTSVMEAVRAVVAGIDPQLPITELSNFDAVAMEARSRERFLASVLGVFALLSLAIAGMGTYGVVAYAAARRTREFGVRIALGADRRQVVGRVVRGGIQMAFWGAALGVVASLLLGPLLQGLLFGVDARDPLTLLAGPVMMTVIVLAASAAPAWKASRTDPRQALVEDG